MCGHIMAGHIKNSGLYSKNKGTYQSFLSKDARLQVCMLKRCLHLNGRNQIKGVRSGSPETNE